MDINNLSNDQFVDIFSDTNTQIAAPVAPAFGAGTGLDTNILGVEGSASVSDTTTIAIPASTTDTTTISPDGVVDVDADITGEGKESSDNQDGNTSKPGRKPKYAFEDASGYFADRFKSGKLVSIKETAEDGTERDFIPKTPEEFDEVIDIQVNYQLEQKQKELEQKWYSSKSPAWQAVAKYAELTDDPSEIVPFLQGVRTIDSVSSINEEEIDGAEQIVRVRLQQRGEPTDVIDEQIEMLKTTDKLVSTAKKYKPLIVQEEKAQLQQMYAQQKQQEEYRTKLVSEIRENAIKAIETPLFNKVKLKQDEKAAIYDLIGEPDEQSQGYAIYSAIDNLFESRDFDTLRQVALLLTKKDAYINYISSNAADKTAGELQKKLRVAVDSRTASSTSDSDNGGNESRKVVQRAQYTPRFGRG